VRQHYDFRYCLAATLERFFKGFGVGRQQARIMIANLMRRGLSSISALVTDRSLRLPLHRYSGTHQSQRWSGP
jgi:hypothetical protein